MNYVKAQIFTSSVGVIALIVCAISMITLYTYEEPTVSYITWNTDVNAPGCPGEVLSGVGCIARPGTGILIQQDTEFPGIATTFGWSKGSIQMHKCDCPHDGTDGTIACSDCGLQAIDFIESARDWLDDNNGATAEDPGYF